jgi:hypothetical protein
MFEKEQKVEIIDFAKERRRQERKEKFNRKVEDAFNWAYDHKEVLMIAAPVVVGAVTAGTKFIGKQITLHKEQNLKDLYCYDRSLGHYWRLKRELTNSEWVEIDQRKQNGERLADILDELKVLK